MQVRGALEPMLARSVEELPVGRDLVYEPKLDGFRALAVVDSGGGVRLLSRRGARLDRAFPEVVEAVSEYLPPRTVVDGELVCWCDGRLDFTRLQRRLVAGPKAAASARTHPCHLVLFDLLESTGEELTRKPLRERRARLEQILAHVPATSPLTLGMQTDDPDTARLWQRALAPVGVEGLLVKPRAGPYLPGSRGWWKLRSYETTDMIVGGVTGAVAAPTALILGRFTADGRLRVVGRTSALSAAASGDVARWLRPAGPEHPWPTTLPPRWAGTLFGQRESLPYVRVEPTTVVEVRVDTAVDHGRLRHAARFHRVRPEMEPADVPTYRS
ncbi:MAG TPA: ATP-dependent DNA ligase [Actinopolymorphaceae bacterium]